jgi:dTDP-4-amino-4,6-dideoxygalactose transaminase
MIPRLRPDLTWRELAAALRPPSGDDVAAFEAAFAREMGQRQGIAFPYGRTGLIMLLHALGLQDAEVICPAYTCVVVAHAIVRSGNRPVFVDCRQGDFNMDLEAAERLITPRTRALVATSLFGFPVDLDRLDALRSKHPHVRIIQDCAHSFACEWNGRPVQREGDAAMFGLNVSKLMTSVFGGMVTTDDEALAQRLREIRRQRLVNPGLRKSLRRLLYLAAVYPAFHPKLYGVVLALQEARLLNRFTAYYDESLIDMPADYLEAMSRVEARVGLVQTARYRDIVAKRRSRQLQWRRLLSGDGSLSLPPDVAGATYSHFVALAADRAATVASWRARGVQLGELIEYSIPTMPAYRPYQHGDFPVSAHYARHTVNFPLGFDPEEIV